MTWGEPPAPAIARDSSATVSIQATRAHNNWRNEVGVPPLQWSDPVAAYAQEWAEYLARTGKFEHRRNGDYGENIFMSSREHLIDQVVRQMVFKEKANYDPVTGRCRNSGECRHYTQIVWRTTTEVGCGMAVRPDARYSQLQYWVCNYNPPGNVLGRKAY
jgi:pathogenesis-related protein 1